MYIEDLATYQFHLPFSFEGVRCVGWLDAWHRYEIGEPPVGFVEKLERIVLYRTDDVDFHVNVVRGIHECNLCGNDIEYFNVHAGRHSLLGISEIWIPDTLGWFASPSLIIHYVKEHKYIPPPSFVQAVVEMPFPDHFLGQDVYDRFMREKMVQ